MVFPKWLGGDDLLYKPSPAKQVPPTQQKMFAMNVDSQEIEPSLRTTAAM